MATLNTPITEVGLIPADAPEVDGTPEIRLLKAGILPAQRIRELIEKTHITTGQPIEDGQIQPASLDLRLGPTAYRVRASFLPGKFSTVKERIKTLHMAEVDLTRPAILEKGCIYIVPLQEKLNLPANTSGRANPKSTTGRLDIF